ncbi:hypothetical protein J6590_000392 [Homalodisca vitripennis]|nr:hypothetical protein J6590_000392 [Homalodisca vitripennis]
MAGCSRTLRDSEIDLVISSDCDDSSECGDVPEPSEVVGSIEDVVWSDHSGSGSGSGSGSDGEPDNDLHQAQRILSERDRQSELIEVRSTVNAWKQCERERVNSVFLVNQKKDCKEDEAVLPSPFCRWFHGSVEQYEDMHCLAGESHLSSEIHNISLSWLCTISNSNDESGVTCVRLVGHHFVAARLSGSLDFYLLDWASRHSSHRRTHVRSNSADSVPEWSFVDAASEDFKCVCLSTARAHQQPITVLDSEGGRVVTGSQDHTLKVYGLVDQAPFFTLHGHFGPITTLFIDRVTPSMAGSGSQDGLLCVWDLQTAHVQAASHGELWELSTAATVSGCLRFL